MMMFKTTVSLMLLLQKYEKTDVDVIAKDQEEEEKKDEELDSSNNHNTLPH